MSSYHYYNNHQVFSTSNMAFYSSHFLSRCLMNNNKRVYSLSRINGLVAPNKSRNSSSTASTTSTTSSPSTYPTTSALKLAPLNNGSAESIRSAVTTPVWPLQRLSTAALLRTIFLSRLFANPNLSRFGINILQMLAGSRNPLLDPDRNWLLNRILRAVIYNHFCAGAEPSEICKTVASIKGVGYAGVILNYAREIIAHELAESDPNVNISAQQIQHWLDGNLQTLSMIGRGDYIGIKYTGAGSRVASALIAGEEPPQQFQDALDKICQQAQIQGTRILVDAEQQVYQSTIDKWTIDMMRKYNRGGNSLVLNTYQSYLKASRNVIRDHLEIAHREGWTLGIKLVRGAYILNEVRERIHDTKSETDASYNGIAHDLLLRSFDDITRNKFPDVQLFLAGHNADSIRRAVQLHRDLTLRDLSPGTLELGQLYGMADHVSGELLAYAEAPKRYGELSKEQIALASNAAPLVFKCVNWGTVRECLHFLMRRAAENQGAVERLKDGLAEAKRELKARLFRTAR
ncbi:proline dehydrogenase [Biscogniauxia marginata]|nr:proline dehydrogenase [Biscogniauxia marginata]